jgi:hypothetical protein
MTKIPNYILVNQQRIIYQNNSDNLYENSNLKSYDNIAFKKFSIIKKVDKIFERNNYILTKNEVIGLFKKDDLYLAIVCSMIWGGINATRSKDKTGTFFYNFLLYTNENKNLFIRNIKKLIKLLETENFEKAFDFYSNEAKIPGVGSAYFTKIFYFLGQANTNINPKPLIFDKWTSNAYLALLLQNGEIKKVEKYFKGINFNFNKTPGTVFLNQKTSSECYQDFVNDFDKWSNKIETTSSSIEEFIFGQHLGQNKNKTNPRIELWNIILDNLTILLK